MLPKALTQIEDALVSLAALSAEVGDPLMEGMALAMIRVHALPNRVRRDFINIVHDAIRLIEDIQQEES